MSDGTPCHCSDGVTCVYYMIQYKVMTRDIEKLVCFCIITDKITSIITNTAMVCAPIPGTVHLLQAAPAPV